MSSYLASVGPLLRRGSPFPGRQLLVFDDILVEIRASGLANVHTVGGDSGNLVLDLGGPLILALARWVGERRNQAVWAAPPSPDELQRSGRTTWSASTSVIVEAVLSRHRSLGGSRRIVIRTTEGQKVFHYDAIESADQRVIEAMEKALGDRFRSALKS